MLHWLRLFPLLVVLIMLGNHGVVAAAESKAVHTMAEILLKLNHYPSATEKEQLQHIADDKAATAHERLLAQALSNVQHTASATDKPKLQALLQDAAAPAAIKTLAGILYNLNHTVSEADKEKLKQLL